MKLPKLPKIIQHHIEQIRKPPTEVPKPDVDRINRELKYAEKIRRVNPKIKMLGDRRAKANGRHYHGDK